MTTTTTINPIMQELLEKYGHQTTRGGVDTILQEWEKNKSTLLGLLSKHPQWNADRLAVVLSADWHKGTDPERVYYFVNWLSSFCTSSAIVHFGPLGGACHRLAKETTTGSALLDDETAVLMNEIAPIGAVKGQKVSRALNKLAKALKANEDAEYNRKFAIAADACSTSSTRKPTIISVHPMDYLTMSFGNGWKSCHTIDRFDTRGSGEGHGGCYCSGTLSYMMDGASAVAYTIREDEIPEFLNSADSVDGFEIDKLDRCMMYVAEDGGCFVQSRVYPQCSDGDTGIISSYRSIMQTVLAECMGVPSMWKVSKGTVAAGNVISSNPEGTHYKDYNQFSTVTVSRLTAIDAKDTDEEPAYFKKIIVGHAPICPDCGSVHGENDKINCYRCDIGPIGSCAFCDSVIRENDYDTTYAGDEVYCCEECATNAGWFWCSNIDDYAYENEVHEDGYTGENFAEDSATVYAEDGTYFMNYENAERGGYACDDDGDWYPDHEIVYCEHCERYLHIDLWDADEDACDDCAADIRREQALHEDEDDTDAQPVHMVARSAA